MSLDLTEFYEHEMTDEVIDSVEQLRRNLREYNQAKVAEAAAAARKKEAKKQIDDLFKEIPDQYKATIADTPKEVAGEIFSREKKTITIDGSVIIMRDRIDTTFERDKFMKWIDGEINSAPADDAVILEGVKTHINNGLSPHRTQVVTIEPVKESK
jgi:hypothetical protein